MEESSVGELKSAKGKNMYASRAIRLSRWAPDCAATSDGASGAEAAAEPEPEDEGNVIRSPIVGTFYRASSPGARPFVVGSTVSEGETVCIIQAMKILNQIEADCSGVVREVWSKTVHL